MAQSKKPPEPAAFCSPLSDVFGAGQERNNGISFPERLRSRRRIG
jgi:hypothetical protein